MTRTPTAPKAHQRIRRVVIVRADDAPHLDLTARLCFKKSPSDVGKDRITTFEGYAVNAPIAS